MITELGLFYYLGLPLLALIFTILIEFIVYSISFRKNYGRLFLYAVLINALTNPLANLSSAYMNIFLIEFFVIIAEMFFIKYLFEVKYWKAILISLIANIISFVLGFLFFNFF